MRITIAQILILINVIIFLFTGRKFPTISESYDEILQPKVERRMCVFLFRNHLTAFGDFIVSL